MLFNLWSKWLSPVSSFTKVSNYLPRKFEKHQGTLTKRILIKSALLLYYFSQLLMCLVSRLMKYALLNFLCECFFFDFVYTLDNLLECCRWFFILLRQVIRIGPQRLFDWYLFLNGKFWIRISVSILFILKQRLGTTGIECILVEGSHTNK